MSLPQACLGLFDILHSVLSASWPGRAAGLYRGGHLQCHPGKVFELSLS